VADGDGIEICHAARVQPQPPLVVMTTEILERVPAALTAGCNAVLLKPYSPNLLCARLGRLLQMPTGSRTLRRSTPDTDIAVSVHGLPAASRTTNERWEDMALAAAGPVS
jgi:DNA-binding response OmpR family regulator